MTFFPYIQSWESVEHLVLQMEEDFLPIPYKVINSTNKIYNKPNWIDQGDYWYYGSFYTALKDFNPTYDYFVYICGDMTAVRWATLLQKAQEILNTYLLGGLSFLSDVEYMNEEKSGIGHLETDISMRYQVCLDGQVVFYHKSIIAKVLDFFNYLNQKIDILSIKHGWGVDMVVSAFAIDMQQPLVKYDPIKIFNTSAFQYDLNIGFTECDIFLNVFKEYCAEYKLDNLLETFEKILMRIGYKQPLQQLQWSDFYLGVKPF